MDGLGVTDLAGSTLGSVVERDAEALSANLSALRQRLFPPSARKTLRTFSSGEVAALIGISDAYLRQLELSGEIQGPAKLPRGHRAYTLEEVNTIRRHLGRAPRGRVYHPVRGGAERLQTIAITNFKGGSGKTTTAVHLSQYLALRGYRVLALDLDPQASLSALFGFQPEFDVAENETVYGAVRYDSYARPLASLARQTYFAGLDLVPGNLELQEFEHETPRMLAQGRRADGVFFTRLAKAIASVEDRYDIVVIDCPPQLGYLTLSALCAATGIIVTVHPQMLDVASMSQFLLMTADLLAVVADAGARFEFSFLRYLITRFEPQDGPQAQVSAFLRNLFGPRVLTNAMLKSTLVSDAGLTKQTLYEIPRHGVGRGTYSRALEAVNNVNAEVEDLIRAAWSRCA
jgi:chromosome partitioning protein